MSGLAREVAAVLGALGVLVLLVPVPGPAGATARRTAGLALTLVAWGLLLASVVPGDDARSALDRLASPAAAGGAAVAVVAALVVAVLLVRLIVRRPTAFFVLLALALPVRVPVSVGSQEANLLVPLYAVVVLGLAAFVVARARGGLGPAEEPRTVLDLPLAAFVALVLVSILWSPDPAQGAVNGGCFYLPFALLYVLVVAWWPRAQAVRALCLTTLAVAVPVAVLALGQYATRTIWWNETLQQSNVYSRFFRVNGIFYDPNILGRFLVVALICAAALAWWSRRPRELAALAAAGAVLTAGLMVTFSRSSALMLMTAAALVGVRAVGPRRALGVGAVLLVVIGAASIAASANVRDAVTSTDRLERVSEGRFDLMRGGLTIWRERPVAGVGLGGFEDRFEAGLTRVEQQRVRVVVSHNAPITTLSENGAIGLALAVLLGLAAAVRLGAGADADGVRGWARWTALAILAGIVVHSLFYAALFEDPYTWVLAGAAAALAVPPRDAAEPRAAEPTAAVAVT